MNAAVDCVRVIGRMGLDPRALVNSIRLRECQVRYPGHHLSRTRETRALFLSILRPEQQTLYLQAARELLQADGAVASPEAALLEAARIECDVDQLPEAVAEVELLERAPSVLDSPAARNTFLLELAGAMVVDGETSVDELALLGRFADVLGISEGALDDFVAFAERARDLAMDGQR